MAFWETQKWEAQHSEPEDKTNLTESELEVKLSTVYKKGSGGIDLDCSSLILLDGYTAADFDVKNGMEDYIEFDDESIAPRAREIKTVREATWYEKTKDSLESSGLGGRTALVFVDVGVWIANVVGKFAGFEIGGTSKTSESDVFDRKYHAMFNRRQLDDYPVTNMGYVKVFDRKKTDSNTSKRDVVVHEFEKACSGRKYVSDLLRDYAASRAGDPDYRVEDPEKLAEAAEMILVKRTFHLDGEKLDALMEAKGLNEMKINVGYRFFLDDHSVRRHKWEGSVHTLTTWQSAKTPHITAYHTPPHYRAMAVSR